MRPIVVSFSAVLSALVSISACGSSFKAATAPAPPSTRPTPAVGEVPDAILLDVIQKSELIVLAIPQDLVVADGFTPGIQLGAKETWYNVRLTVDSLMKGHLGQAKAPDFGWLPKVYEPPVPFEKLARNEIVVQYPAVTTLASDWAGAPPPVVGERAVFLFRRCYNCVTVGMSTGRGPYRANPLVAAGWGSKLDAAEWSRVLALVSKTKRHHS